MSWLRVDDLFVLNKKVGELSDRELRALLALWSYCAREKNGGVIHHDEIRHAAFTTPQGARSVTRANLERFIALGLVNEVEASDLLQINDWQTYQPKDATKAERQARWRASLASTEASTEASTPPSTGETEQASTRPSTHARARAPVPVPSRPKPLEPSTNHAAVVKDAAAREIDFVGVLKAI